MNRNTLRNILLTGALAATVVTVAVACDTPDTQGRFDEFAANTVDDRKGPADTGMDIPEPEGSRVDFGGTYLMAVEVAGIGAGRPLHLQADVTVDLETNTIAMTLQPLKSDVDAQTQEVRADARTAVGAALSFENIAFEEDGTFVADLGHVEVEGEANPLTGSFIEADMVLHGIVANAEVFCGSVTGMVTVPSNIPLEGSTFGVVKGTEFATVTPMSTCPADVGNNGDMDAGMDVPEDAPDDAGDTGEDTGPVLPTGRCVDGLDGEYDFTFQTTQQDSPSTVTMTLVRSDDDAVCYTGELLSQEDGTTNLGMVEYALEIDGILTIYYDFIIPPGANPLLPNGGRSKGTLSADRWASHGSCGPMELALYDPFTLSAGGVFTMLKQGVEGYTVSGPGCDMVAADEECAFTSLAGAYHLQFMTSAGVTNVFMNLEADSFTCLDGTLVSKINEGEVIARLQAASPAEDAADQVFLNFRNFIIAPGANPLLPDGGKSDMKFTSTSVEGAFCGSLVAGLFEPFALDSQGTFNTTLADGAEPASPACE